jgi:hypothetical protein
MIVFNLCDILVRYSPISLIIRLTFSGDITMPVTLLVLQHPIVVANAITKTDNLSFYSSTITCFQISIELLALQRYIRRTLREVFPVPCKPSWFIVSLRC